MAAPSKAWVTIADSQVDADSPLDTTLIAGLRDDVVHARETVYDPAVHTAAKGHKHNGTDSYQISDTDISRTSATGRFYDFIDDNSLGAFAINDSGNGATLSSTANGVVLITIANTSTLGGMRQTNRTYKITSTNILTWECVAEKVGSHRYGCYGLSDGSWTSATWTPAPNNGVWFEISNSSNLKAVTRAAGTSTTTDTGIAMPAAGTPIKMKIVGTTSSVKFYLDDVLKATHTTNIPSTSTLLGPVMECWSNLEASQTKKVDWIDIKSNERM